MAAAREAIHERVLRLGDDGHLVAIASDPPAADETPTAILLNAGVLHRVGPHRLHVRLARKLAAQGIPALRIDLSGIGDSRPLPSGLGFRASSVADVRAAMDQVGGTTGRFVLFGVCSGADNALATAEVDPRVAGLVLVDPPAYATAASRWRRRRASARDPAYLLALPRRIAAALARRARRLWSKPGAPKPGHEPAPGRKSPPLPDFRRQMDALLGRGVRILAIYSGALGDRCNARDQLFEALPELRGRIELEWFADANHTFTERSAQAALLDVVLAWFERHFRTPPRATGAEAQADAAGQRQTRHGAA